jgi:multimeric flavodoxin WrbA
MRITVLDGFRQAEGSAATLAALKENAEINGHALEVIALRERTVAPCIGCFGCWVKTPGVCVIKDEAPEITKTIVRSDLAVYLTPITFGGYSSLLKAQLDRSIGMMRPEFRDVAGETHHRTRYACYPRILGLGLLQKPDAEMEETFKFMLKRNALNMFAREARTVIVHESDSASMKAEKIASAMRGWR